MKKIQMVDLTNQLTPIRPEIDFAISEVLKQSDFINGEVVESFETNLATWAGAEHVVSCANGTDALQLALMCLDLNPGDEVLLPVFTYVATVEVIALLGLIPVYVDVCLDTFNIDIQNAENVITKRSKVIVPVHLYGQCADMERIMNFANKHSLFVIEDTAQAIGAKVKFSDGSEQNAGTIGHIGTTSFFPSKNLGCFGDGGALFTNDSELASILRMLKNHGQKIKYVHDIVGVNSRLDSIQAAVLDVKLKYLNSYNLKRAAAADIYDQVFSGVKEIQTPFRAKYSSHVFHQYTLKILKPDLRNDLINYLGKQGIPTMIYYPIPLHQQKAYSKYNTSGNEYLASETLCSQVLSIPMHTELKEEELKFISKHISLFFNQN